ncbi:MAG: PQQ-dependent sugar dehydrogenase [Patescibacteria group bacterium]
MNNSLTKNWLTTAGFEIKNVATNLDLPVNIAFVEKEKRGEDKPLCYVNELYGKVKVFNDKFEIFTYAEDLLNFKQQREDIPGKGECGLTGICIEKETGDLFLSMTYIDNGKFKSRVIRTTSIDGFKMESSKIIIENIPSVHAAHQIQALNIGPDNKLYINLGDGMLDSSVAQDDNDLRGKILRLNLDGSIPSDNPNPKSPVFAKGVRNPFGGTFRKSNQSLYVSDNGPDRNDRIMRIKAGENYGWPDNIRQNIIFDWYITQAPTAMAFNQDNIFSEEYNDFLFLNLFGTSYFEGKTVKGKKMVMLEIDKENDNVLSYTDFLQYNGNGPASPCGLAFGPDGLYFTDLHGEKNEKGEPKGNIFCIKQTK